MAQMRIVALLVATFLLTAFMAVRAQMAAQYHRTTAERVIRDWTRVAAEELARRADVQAEFYGTYPLLQRLLAGDRVSSPLMGCTFRFAGGEVTAPECSAETRAWLRPRLAAILANPPEPAAREPLHWEGVERSPVPGTRGLSPAPETSGSGSRASDHAVRTFAYALSRDASALVGFEVHRPALGTFFPAVLEARPLMPPSLAEGRVTNEAVRVRVRDGARVVFAKGDVDALPVRVPVEEGLLRGMAVEASIDPYVAPRIVFGGVPRPLPVYTITLLLTGALLFVAVVQVRREHALSRLRSDFIASVSHELRTPLTQIRMFAETLLLERVRSDEERRRALTVIDQETRRLAQLVENVLQFSRGERDTLRLTRTAVDVAALVAETAETFRPIAAARGVRVVAALPPSAVIEADRDAVQQIVLNLLDNAVKYGPPGQEVRVDVEKTPGVVRIAVDDAGPGVPPRDRARIWRRYERLERERERAVAGAGIGLAVVGELVALHHGRAWVEEGPRGGARFVVELPP